jgi:type I restriction enzyme, S subunit
MNYPHTQIGQLCLPTEQRDPRSSPDLPFRYVDISSVDKDMKTIVQTQEIAGRDAPSRARKVICTGDVLVSTVRPNLNAVAIVPPEFDEQIASTGFCVLRPQSALLDARYLFYWTLTPEFVAYLTARMRGANYPAVTDAVVKKATIPLPPISEQRRLVEILDQTNALRKKRAEADAKAERVLHALFIKIFGDPAANSRGWDWIPLRKLLRNNKGALQSGPFGSNLHNADFVDEGTVFVVGIDNVHDTGFQIGRNRRITWEKYQELKKFKLEHRDVLITIMGTVGRTCVFPEWIGEAICTKHVYRIQTNQNLLNPEYLCASIRFSPAVRAQLGSSITGQIVDAITSKDLKELLVDVPPIDLQRRFADHKKSLDDEAVRRKDSRMKLDYISDALLHRAFSGKLTAKWREAHTKDILAEMEEQAKYLAAHGACGQRENAALQESLF